MADIPRRQLNELDPSQRLGLLIDAVKDYAIYLLDAEGRVATWNTGAQLFKGYSADEIIGQHFSVFYTPEDRAISLPARALHVAATEGRFEAEGWRVRKDGARFWTHVVIDPVFDDDGALMGYAKITRNVTQKRRAAEAIEAAREALVQAQKMEAIGRLTGGVAHDFNNLLTVIRASAEFLRRPNLTEAKRAQYVEAIASTAERATVLTGQLLAFARRQPLQPEVFDIGARLRGLSQIVNATLGAAVAFELDLPEEPQLVFADPSQFETAVLNMVINARDAMPGGGAITVACGRADGVPAVRGHAAAKGDFITIAIADAGMGMSDDTLLRVFEPFFTTKDVDKGTGLGLSQVYGFAKQSSGEIDVKSTLGEGSTFILYLPRAAGAVASPPKPVVVEPRDLRVRRILLVEDNEGVGQFARQLLGELGQKVTWAGDAQAALYILEDRSEAFDVVFTDVVMPGMSGVELARQVAERWPRIEVILTSGYSHILVEEGSHGFPLLRKPYSIDSLMAVLRRG